MGSTINQYLRCGAGVETRDDSVLDQREEAQDLENENNYTICNHGYCVINRNRSQWVIQVLCNAVEVVSYFSEKKQCEGVRLNVISVTRRWVGVNFPGKTRHVTLEWPPNQIYRKKHQKNRTHLPRPSDPLYCAANSSTF